jgi:phenylacetate-CoA ligase
MLVSFMDFSVEYLELGQLRQLQSERLVKLVGYLGEKSEFYKRKFDELQDISTGYKVN